MLETKYSIRHNLEHDDAHLFKFDKKNEKTHELLYG